MKHCFLIPPNKRKSIPLSFDEICSLTAMSKSSAIRVTKELEKKGIIKVVRSPGKSNKHTLLELPFIKTVVGD